MGSLLQFNFSSSLLAGNANPAIPFDNGLAGDGHKVAVLSSGKTTTLKPRIRKTDTYEPERDNTELINIHRLLSKIEIEEKVAEKSSELVPKKLENKFKKTSFKLWTEKYRPSSFLDLIGNERTNRIILQWINQWNQVVFNKSCTETDDIYNRPDKRILLIHGPPGIGKTSIAHVIAKQLDYEVREINASDERAGVVVQDKIKNAMKNNSLTGKPVCLILDEVDGATENGFINVLVDLVNKDRRDTASIGLDGRKKQEKSILRRPIIALCNDVYSPVLEKLRPLCDTIAFRKSHSRLIKSKLKKICERENIVTEDRVLDAIIESTEGDLRNCINFLQFNSAATTLDLDSSSKDTQIGWFVQLDNILMRSAKVSKQEQFRKVFQSLSASAQVDRVASGCFNVLLDTDADVEKLSEISDWLYFQDAMSSRFNFFEAQDLSFYQSVAPMAVFQRLNEIRHASEKKYNYRSRDTFFEVKKQTTEVLQRLKHNNSLSNRWRFANREQLVGYELPLLNTILVPDVSFRQIEMVGAGTKLKRITELIRAYSLRIDVTKNEYGSIDAHFRPALNLFTRLSIKQQQIMGRLHKELLADYIREQETKQIERKRKGPDPLDKKPAKKATFGSSVEYFKNKCKESSGQSDNNNSKHQDAGLSDDQNEAQADYRIWVKYHEGFSNAVRREITWNGLFII
ncbi:hypothetical protein OGAPHI_004491 [Ogataea philodendri]|uniref:AAA+ ATPase domain-containing protein n=1 Tax=Ogataea philodendri TaxID=1378263 RepID=A0A9P8P6P8_9ASCO|nr:uncharacterized protein OGAPHI_004491 [Ogataea philodendri]KAH3666302.1 hypothetical protein OGAPHI_004491 [Ogataea philodendri]